MKKRTRRLLLGLALTHLMLVTLGAAYIGFDRLGQVGEALDYYGVLSGSGNTYGFFAPGVGGEVRARFTRIDGKGNVTQTTLRSGSSHESDIRFGNIIDQFEDNADADDNDDDDATDLRRSLAASLAGKIFARYPDTHAVEVHLDEFDPVSMADYRKGTRPQWKEYYTARFVYHPSSEDEQLLQHRAMENSEKTEGTTAANTRRVAR